MYLKPGMPIQQVAHKLQAICGVMTPKVAWEPAFDLWVEGQAPGGVVVEIRHPAARVGFYLQGLGRRQFVGYLLDGSAKPLGQLSWLSAQQAAALEALLAELA